MGNNPVYIHGKSSNGILSHNITRTTITEDGIRRIFELDVVHAYMNMVHTVAGRPSAPLENSCGYSEGQPATLAKFNKPTGKLSPTILS